jgi:cell division protein FtsB
MVTRRRLRSFMTVLGLYALGALFIGYFAVHAVSGNRGLKAKQELDRQIIALTQDLNEETAARKKWEHKVSLLQSDRIDPDMLDALARESLAYADPHDLIYALPGKTQTR